MRTHVVAAALVLAGCAAPRAELPEPEPEPQERAPAPQERTRCTAPPCTLEAVQMALRRVALEADAEPKMADANLNAHTKQVADRWMQTLARSIAEERDRFSEWCDTAQGWSADRRKSGAPGLTSEELLKWTGQPPKEVKPESRAEGTESKAWTWDVDGPLSRTVSFAVLFMRPAGTEGPWIFAGCQWCASGGPAITPGCVPLPTKR